MAEYPATIMNRAKRTGTILIDGCSMPDGLGIEAAFCAAMDQQQTTGHYVTRTYPNTFRIDINAGYYDLHFYGGDTLQCIDYWHTETAWRHSRKTDKQ